jgi:peroxidase
MLLVAALSLSVSEVDAQLSFTYYRKSCPNVESIIFKEVQNAFKSDPTVAPGLLRMMFHDCFVRVSTTLPLIFFSKLQS